MPEEPYYFTTTAVDENAPSIFLILYHLRLVEPWKLSGFPSFFQHKKKRPMLQSRPPNANKLLSTVYVKLAEQHARFRAVLARSSYFALDCF